MDRRHEPGAAGPVLLLLEPDRWRAGSLTAALVASGHDVLHELPPGVRPDVVLANLAWPGGEVRARLDGLRTEVADLRVVAFLPSLAPDTVFPSLRMRVKGVLSLDASVEELLAALACVRGGSIWAPRSLLSRWVDRVCDVGPREAVGRDLTRAERRVLEGVRDDLSNKEIARRLGVTESTVKFHVGKLLRRTGTSSRQQLARSFPELP